MRKTRTWFALSAIISLAAAVAYFLWPSSEDDSEEDSADDPDRDLGEGPEKS